MNTTEQEKFQQGDPIVVCRHEEHRRQMIDALQIRAFYVLPLSVIAGRQFSRAIITPQYFLNKRDEEEFYRWIDECVRTAVEPGGGIYKI